MEWLFLVGVLAGIFGGLGAFIATQKRSDVAEGLVMGFLFGSLGVRVEALLPPGDGKSATSVAAGGVYRNIDERGVIAEIAERFRCTLEDVDPDWQRLPYRRKRQILSLAEKKIMNDLRLSPRTWYDLAAEARRAVLEPPSQPA